MSTATLSTFVKPAKHHHAGLNTYIGTYTKATLAELTAASVLKLAKIPNKAVIVGGWIHRLTAVGNLQLNLVYQSGTASTTAIKTLCSASLSGFTYVGIDAAVGLGGVLDYQIDVSVSEGRPFDYAVLQAVVVSATLSGTTTFRLDYLLDDRP